MTKRLIEQTRLVWVIAALGFALFLVTNLPWQLDDYDQAKQAYTSFEMVKAGHWFYQHTPHERIATKPPLVGWISAAIFSVTRSWDLAWRLPSLAAAVALSIMLFRAASVYGAIAGLIATAAFVFNLLTPRLATLVRTDMPLALVIFAIGVLIWDKVRTATSWNSRDRRWIFLLLASAMLIKGPIVYAFLLPGIIVAAVYDRRKHSGQTSTVADRRYSHCSAWPGWWPWVLSLAIFLLWAIGGSVFVPGFYDQVVVREFLGRFGETIHRPQPLFFYLPHLLHKFFPWSVLILALAIFGFRARGELDRLKRSSSRWRDRLNFSPETVWLLCWIFGGLIVMSIIPSKRVDRIFPIVPPLCLLLAAQIGNGRDGSPSRPGPSSPGRVFDRTNIVTPYLYAAILVAILWTGGYAASKIVSGYRDHRDALVEFGRKVRVEAAARHWRYEVLKCNDEGMLLYLDKLHFIDPAHASEEWNKGNLDALVVASNDAPALMGDLRGAELSQLISAPRAGESNYVLITR